MVRVQMRFGVRCVIGGRLVPAEEALLARSGEGDEAHMV